MAKKIRKIWNYTNEAGHCFIFAEVGSGSRSYVSTLGMCDDQEVRTFVHLWHEGFVKTDKDIDTYLRQPLEGLEPTEGGEISPRPIDIEVELDLARNMFGKLAPVYRTRLRAVLYHSTEDTWNDAYSIILNPHVGMGLTLWQAVLAVDPSFPKVGPSTDSRGRVVKRWSRIPSQALLLAALQYATH
jgi:hypothetical protein